MASKPQEKLEQLELPNMSKKAKTGWKMYYKVLPDGHTQIRALKQPPEKK